MNQYVGLNSLPLPSIEAVIRAYPNPSRWDNRNTLANSYCVGGAFLRYISDIAQIKFEPIKIYSYPFTDELYHIFSFFVSNEQVKDKTLYKLTYELIMHSGIGEFDLAWKKLELALNRIGQLRKEHSK